MSKNPSDLIGDDLTLPVNLEKIARKLGIVMADDFIFDDMGNAARTSWDQERIRIWVNPLDSETRRRFSLAHAIGHAVLHMTPNPDPKVRFDDKPQNFRANRHDVVEFEANAFAKMLLMPESILRIEIFRLADARRNTATGKVRMSREDFIENLAEKFGVSPYHMKDRLDEIKAFTKDFARPDPATTNITGEQVNRAKVSSLAAEIAAEEFSIQDEEARGRIEDIAATSPDTARHMLMYALRFIAARGLSGEFADILEEIDAKDLAKENSAGPNF